MWGLEPSRQCENFFGIIVLQFCGSPDRYAAAAAKSLQLCPPHQALPSLGFSRQEYWSGHLTGIGFDFIVIVPLLPSCWGFSVVLGCGVSFLGGFQYLSVYGCSTTSCDFGSLAEGNERMSFYSTILILLNFLSNADVKI